MKEATAEKWATVIASSFLSISIACTLAYLLPVKSKIAESIGLSVAIDGSCTSTSPEPTDALLILKEDVFDGNILDRGSVIDKSVDVRVIIDGEKRDMTWEEFKQRMR